MNKSGTLGLTRPFTSKKNLGPVRTFAEIDLEQVKYIAGLIKERDVLFNKDLSQVELETTLSIFNGKTFFSLFEEQDAVYETLYD